MLVNISKILYIFIFTLFYHSNNASERINYDKWKLFHVSGFPSVQDRLRITEKIEHFEHVRVVEILKDSIQIGVGPLADGTTLKSIVDSFHLNTKVIHGDIGKLIESSKVRSKRSLESDYFGSYMTYEQMENFFSLLETTYPNILQRKIVGTSSEGRNISLFILSSSNPPTDSNPCPSSPQPDSLLHSNHLGSRHQPSVDRRLLVRNADKKQEQVHHRRLIQRRLDLLRRERPKATRQRRSKQKINRMKAPKIEHGIEPIVQRQKRQVGPQLTPGVEHNSRRQIRPQVIRRKKIRNFRQRRFPLHGSKSKNSTHNFIVIAPDIIKYLKQKDTPKKPLIFIDGGVHSREWISPAVALYLIKMLSETPSLTSDMDWYIMPMVNPDGYKFSWENDRFWRKTRSKSGTSGCYGADMNRNFNSHWGEVDTSTNPCSEHYGGTKESSEVETAIITDVIMKEKSRIKAYISLHNWGQDILYPYCHNTNTVTENDAELERVSSGMVEAIRQSHGADYATGRGADLLYPASGTSIDWAYDVIGVHYSYLMELRDNYGLLGFLLPDIFIKPTGEEVFAAMKYLSSEILKKKECNNNK